MPITLFSTCHCKLKKNENRTKGKLISTCPSIYLYRNKRIQSDALKDLLKIFIIWIFSEMPPWPCFYNRSCSEILAVWYIPIYIYMYILYISTFMTALLSAVQTLRRMVLEANMVFQRLWKRTGSCHWRFYEKAISSLFTSQRVVYRYTYRCTLPSVMQCAIWTVQNCIGCEKKEDVPLVRWSDY